MPLPRSRSRAVPADPASPSSILGRGWVLGAGTSTSLSKRQGPGYVAVRVVPYAWSNQESVRLSIPPSPCITGIQMGFANPTCSP